MPCRATQDEWVTEENSDKRGSTVRGTGKPLQYYCSKNTMNSMKRQKDMTPDDVSARQSNMLLGKNGRQLLIAPERMK